MEPKNREEIQPLLDISGGSMQLVPYDGCAEFVAKSAEEFTRFMKEVYDSPHLIGNTLSPQTHSLPMPWLTLYSRLRKTFLRFDEGISCYVWLRELDFWSSDSDAGRERWDPGL